MPSFNYNFTSPIVIILKKRIEKKANVSTLNIENDSVYVQNWSIPIKHICAPILDEDQEILRLKDNKGDKEFKCYYGANNSNRRNQTRGRRGQIEERYKRRKNEIPVGLRDFINNLEQLLLKYQKKYGNKESLRDLNSHGPNIKSRKISNKRSYNDWTSPTKSKFRAQRQYGGKMSKRSRRMEKIVQTWEQGYWDDEGDSKETQVIENETLKKTEEKQNNNEELNMEGEIQEDITVSDDNSNEQIIALDPDLKVENERSSDPKRIVENSFENTDDASINVSSEKKKKSRLRSKRKKLEDDDDDSLIFLDPTNDECQQIESRIPDSTKQEDTLAIISEKDDCVSACVTVSDDEERNSSGQSLEQNSETTKMNEKIKTDDSYKKTSISSYFLPKKKNLISITQEQAQENEARTKKTAELEGSASSHYDNDIAMKNKSKYSNSPIINAQKENTNQAVKLDTRISKSSALHPFYIPMEKGEKDTPPSKNILPKDTFENHFVTPTSPSEMSCKNSRGAPTLARSSNARHCLYPGLSNLGNTCYVNSSLQFLLSAPQFFQSLVTDRHNLSSTKMINCNNTKKRTNHDSSLYTSLTNLYKDMINERNRGKVLSASHLKKCIDKSSKRFIGFEQRDAHEFTSDLIDLLHVEMDSNKGTTRTLNMDQEEEDLNIENKEDINDKKIKFFMKREEKQHPLPTDEFFHMKVNVCLTCDSCNYKRKKEEIYRHLSLDVDSSKDCDDSILEKSLQQFFAQEKREIKCEKCEEGRLATQTMELIQKPKILILHLKRFIMRKQSSNKQTISKKIVLEKDQVSVNYPSRLNMCSASFNKSVGKANYKLRSLVHHIGSNAYCGHYTTDAWRNDRWIRFDDGLVKEVTEEDVMKNGDVNKSVYMLLYELEEN